MTDRTQPEAWDLADWLEAVGGGGVSGPLMGQPQAMPDLSALQEWARQILSGPHDTIEGKSNGWWHTFGERVVAWQDTPAPPQGAAKGDGNG